MNKKCPNCNVVNFMNAEKCVRCESVLETSGVEINRKISSKTPQKTLGAKIFRRAGVCAAVCLAVIFGFYLSLLMSSKPLAYDEKITVKKTIEILEAKGFENEVFLLRRLTSFRANDNWLNASTRDENAYAATNFPFEIITIYPEFFTVPLDDTERAMILLHEAQHLKGADEKEAYEFVWRSRKNLGWTRETHGASKIYINVEKQTREIAPNLFRCDWVKSGDCTE
jgi:phage FluMu protein Com